MRYTCDIPGFEDNYIELSERWTRREMATSRTATGDAYFALLQRKVTAIYLSRVDEATGNPIDPIDNPSAFTTEAVDAVDYMVWRWVAYAVRRGLDDLYSLGEESARRWSSALDTATAPPDNPT